MNEEQQVPIVENQQPQNPIEENNPLSKNRKLLFIGIIVFFLLITIIISTFSYFKYREKGESIKVNISTTTTTKESLLSPTPSEQVGIPTPEFVQNELIIKYKQEMGPDEISPERKAEIDNYFKKLGIISQRKIYESSSSALKNYYIINLETEVNLDSVISTINELPEIENVEKNYINKID